MLCNKCNHPLPDDSEFCQYCGNRLEKENAINTILQVQAKETIKAMDANCQSQPDHENDADFGLVPEKPIYTLALMSVDGEKEYLNKLYTANGEKIAWSRLGSTTVDGVNGIIDIYDTYLPSGQPYKTIYINMYGAKTSRAVPKGFVMRNSTINDSPKKSTASDSANRPARNLFSSTAIISIVLSVVCVLSIIAAMNVQDIYKNIYEPINPTILYLILVGIFVACIIFFFICKNKRSATAQHLFAFMPSLFSIGALIEGSLFSSSYLSNGTWINYIHSDSLNLLNVTWVLISFVILIINLAPLSASIQANWHASVRYREKCYRKVARMKDYMDKGIISKEEYEKNKRDLLKHIQL